MKLFYCIRNICDSGQSIFKHANFTEVVNSLMTYVGGKLLVFITIKKTLIQLCLVCGWYSQLVMLPPEMVPLVDVHGAWSERSDHLS